MQQKMIQIGNSYGIILSQALRNEIGLNIDGPIDVSIEDNKIIVSSIKKPKTLGVDVKFMQDVDEFIEAHKDVLSQLAHR